MARRLIWSPSALDDVAAIAEFIERDSHFYAHSVVRAIFARVLALPANAEIGRLVPEINSQTIREVFVYNYRIIYQLNDGSIIIVSVIHGRRLLDGVIERINVS